MKLVSQKSLKGIVNDAWKGIKKSAIIVALVPVLSYANLKLNYEYAGPQRSDVDLRQKTFNCITCHTFDENVMRNYVAKRE